MAVTLKVTGNGHFAGAETNLSGYSVQEDATPTVGGDNSGGVGQIDFTVIEDKGPEGTILLLNDTVELTDDSNGRTNGDVSSVSVNDGVASISAISRLGRLVATRTVQPYTGTLTGAFTYYFSLAGITSGFSFDSALTPATRTNLIKNPSGRRTLTGYSALNGTMGQDIGLDTYVVSAGSFVAGNVGVLIQGFTIGTDLLPNTTYTVSGSVYQSNPSSTSKFFLTGSVTANSPGVTGWGTTSLTFTTPASGSINLWVLNGANVVAGDVVAFRDLLLEVGSTAGTYFDGSYPVKGFTGYSWTGATDNSTSVQGPKQVSYVGFTGDVWDWLKQICVAQQIEISLVSSNIVVRPIRGREAEVHKNSSVSWSVANGDIARAVRVWQYNSYRQVNGLVYPAGGWNSDVAVYQVDANEVLTVNIPVNVSIESLQQPSVVSYVDRAYTGPSSVYAVAGNDGLPVPPAQWTAQGGSLTVAIGEDTRSIDVTITGASDPVGTYAPYRIAMSAGPSNYYSSLRLIGTGVFFSKQSYDFTTGVPNDKTATEIGVEIDSPAINTIQEAYTIGIGAAQRWAGADQGISVSATVINRKGDKGTYNYPTFAQFDTDYAGKTFAQFDTTWTGKTFADFNNAYYASVADTFENQAFGNVAGARVKHRQAYYRIRNATTTEAGIQYSAERDTTFADFDAVWTGKTFADFDTRFTGKTFADFGVIPLWT